MCKAVLSRSEPQLLAAVENHFDQIDEPSFLQLSPLHLSVGWPYGIDALLKHGAKLDVTDQNGYNPVDHAIYRPCSKSLKLFETADIALHEQLNLAIYLEYLASSQDRSMRAGIVDIMIRMEANRRRRLQSLLNDSLPERESCSLLFCEDRILDEQAPAAKAALEQHQGSIPIWLRPGYDHGTVYHLCAFQTVRVLNTFWEAGFRDVNGLDRIGQTPLMAMKFVAMTFENVLENLAWFENKGVNLHEKIHHLHKKSRIQVDSELKGLYLSSGHTVVHYVCHSLPDRPDWICSASEPGRIYEFGFSRLSEGSQAYLRRIFSGNIQDACQCRCSSAGCQALHMLFKRMFQKPWRCEGELKELLSFIQPNGMNFNEMLSEIVRIWTFEKLNLTHTCCQRRRCIFNEENNKFILISFENRGLYPSYGNNERLILVPLESEEIREIYEEEQEDLELLETLLVEFEQRRKELGYPSIGEFMAGYWQTRMEEVLSERKPMDYDKIRELGVVLRDSGSD